MIRCYDCGCRLSAGEAVRRDVQVSATTVGGIRTPGQFDPVYLNTAQTLRVDLCPDCDAERGRRERVGAVFMLVFLLAVPVVCAIGLVLLWAFVRYASAH